ncbi:21286_t:CDS:2 [Gigaspora margarita]|uniref:21286_t:CDS:1 n=1 Tax=Gigaspora margarita TaxID=4874 RepID=A0ABN7UWM0_GIGMA|nr:21286_t:CDS:2 [Gigaspora margarita]
MKGWKLESLLNWAEEESIVIIEITETNMAEREGNFLAYSTNKKRAMGEARRCSKESKQIYDRDYVIPKADGVSNNRSIYAAE